MEWDGMGWEGNGVGCAQDGQTEDDAENSVESVVPRNRWPQPHNLHRKLRLGLRFESSPVCPTVCCTPPWPSAADD